MVLGACGAAEDGAGDGSESGKASPTQTEVAANTELARIEFEDGNVVRFEELYGGVFISETGSVLNARHLTPKDGVTALETFKALAPGRAVPQALMDVHARMYPSGAKLVNTKSTPVGAATDTEKQSTAPDLEHNGEFQQLFPSSTFVTQMCPFPTVAPSYIHLNRTDPHTDVSLNIHTAYYAAGADIGIITEQACAGKSDSRGAFVSQCNSPTVVNPGFAVEGTYDAGLKCSKSCGLFGGGCITICDGPNLVRWDLHHVNISPSVRFHDCALLSRN